ncbi:TfuA-related McrA-glycine thioamidation protein [Methanimicrococcus sp. OttesenSCG-928-J09]|nr:TfuA-related McrA-glycine thioamidation protein [Methanimicrococcus sp. OttesenSCG-928-J09]
MSEKSVIVFLGPSLDLETARSILLSADYRPPASRGDLEKAAREGPDIICLIDGVFFEQCSVGHREILGALKQGISVIGASSMGALRASETESFGMIGIGQVFELYKNKIVESDDEVAVICDPRTNEALSEALVNIRATIEKAVDESVLSAEEGILFLETAAGIYYPDRIYDHFIDLLKNETACLDSVSKFEEWILNGNAKDIKKEDAISALKYVQTLILEK